MQLINGYLKKYRVCENLKIRVRKYLEYIWKIENSEKEKKCEEILKELPNSLREELLIQSRLWTVQSLFSRHFKQSTVNRILNALVHTQYSKEEWIFQEGDNSENSLFIVTKGNVALILNQGKPSKSNFIEMDLKKQLIQPGEHFDLHSFFLDAPKPYSAKAKSVCSLFRLGRKEFLEILKENQEDFEKFCMIRDKSFLNRDLSSLGQRCKSCGEPFHILLNCPYLCYQPFKSIIVRKHLYSKVQKRSKYKRKKKSFSNSLGKTSSLAGHEEIKNSIKSFQEARNDLIKELEEFNIAWQEGLPRFTLYFTMNEEKTMESKILKDDANAEEAQKRTDLVSLREIERFREFNDELEEMNSVIPIKRKLKPNLSICSPEASKKEFHHEFPDVKQNTRESKLHFPSYSHMRSNEEYTLLQHHPEDLKNTKVFKQSLSKKRSKITSIDIEQNGEESEEYNKLPKTQTFLTTNTNNKSSKLTVVENLFARDMDKGHNFSFYIPYNNKAEVITNLNKIRFEKYKVNMKYF